MKYIDGQEVRLVDKMALFSDGGFGVVVCDIDNGEYDTDHPKEHWAHLKRGVVFLTDETGLVHYTKPGPWVRLLARRS